jgi:CHAT domain-containing protein/tetratricopeptide (TPR) repeat protein
VSLAKKQPIYSFCMNFRQFFLFFALVCCHSQQLFSQDWKFYSKQAEKNYVAGELQQAVFWAEKATIEVRSKFGSQNPAYSFVFDNLAKIYVEIGEYEQAEKLYIETKDNRKTVLGENHLDYATALDNLALVYQLMGNYAKATPILLISKEIREQNASTLHPDYAHTLDNLAFLYEQLGIYEKAEAFYWQSKEIKAQILGKKSTDYANTLHSLAELCMQQQKYEQAENLYQECLKITQKVEGKKSNSYATTLDGLAALYVKQKKYAQAKQLIEESIAITEKIYDKFHPDYALNINTLAYILSKEKEYRKAETLYQESLAILEQRLGKHHTYYTNTLFQLAMLHEEQENYQKAEEYYLLVNQKKHEQLAKLFPVLSEVEKLSFYKSIKHFFNTFNAFAIKYSKENPKILCKVLENQLAIKGMLFVNSQKLRRAISSSQDSSLVNLFFELKTQKEKLANIFYTDTKQFRQILQQQVEQEKQALEIKIDKIEKKLAAKLANNNLQVVNNQEVASWEDIQKSLSANELFVELLRIPKEDDLQNLSYTALIVTAETKQFPICVQLTNGEELEKAALRFYKYSLIEQRTDNESYNQYWLPIRKVLDVFLEKQPFAKIYICPDGVYNQINFNGLLNPETGNYLVEEQNIYLLTNGKDLLTKKSQEEENNFAVSLQNCVLLGCPEYDLPAAETELKQIDTILTKNNRKTTILLNENASKEFLKNMQGVSLLHLATHGFFDKLPTNHTSPTTNPENITHPLLRCGLVLGSAKTTDKTAEKIASKTISSEQILTAYEAVNLPLSDTKLVVLSACETGAGEIHDGEGIYGLQRAFFVAGANTLLMSLWKVNDRATQLLMQAFYENLVQEKYSPQVALKKAQQKLREKYQHPYFWAAFVVVGK